MQKRVQRPGETLINSAAHACAGVDDDVPDPRCHNVMPSIDVSTMPTADSAQRDWPGGRRRVLQRSGLRHDAAVAQG